MRAVVQRVSEASVSVDGQIVSSIGTGLLVLLGVAQGDSEKQSQWLAEKLSSLRIFPDSSGKMNLSVLDVGGGVIVVSQFTLLADVRKGRRPSFEDAAEPRLAEELYRGFIRLLGQKGCSVGGGVFGAHMQVSLVNDGPVTIVVDSP